MMDGVRNSRLMDVLMELESIQEQEQEQQPSHVDNFGSADGETDMVSSAHPDPPVVEASVSLVHAEVDLFD